MPITFLDEEEDIVLPVTPTKRKITFLDEEDDQTQLQSVRDRFAPRPLITEKEEKEIGTLEGISNAAKNAFDSSRQAMDVVGGVTPEEAKNIAKIEFDKKSRKLAPGYDEYQKAEGVDAVWAFAKNPIEVTSNIIAEGLAGSLPALGAGLTAGGVGAAAGSVIPVLGTAAGFTAGQVAGTFAGSLATEYGGKVLEELQGEGMDISDPNSIQTFFGNEELVSKARDKALKRGVPIAAFDAVSAGIGGKLGRIFGTKAITEGGKIIGKEFATKTGEALTELGTQAFLGAGSEVAGALAAGETPSVKAAFGEAIGEVGTGGVEVITGRIADKRAMAKAQEDAKIKAAADLSTTLEENSSPLTAKVVTAKSATSIEQDKLAAQLEEELSLTAAKPTAAPPIAIPTKDEYVARYSAIAETAPEELTRAEQSFTNELAAADTEEKRINAQNALDAIKEVKASVVPPPPTITPPVITQPAAVAAQPTTTYATEEIIQPEGVRQEPQDGTQIGKTAEAGVGRGLLGAARGEEEGQVDPVVAGLQAVANNTATNEQIASLSLSGLVDVRRGQAIINEDGEGILAQAQAPLPKLTPEERAAEVEATPRPLPTDALPTETPGATYGRESELFDVFAGVRRRPVDVTEPTIREIPQTSPMIGEQPVEPIISEKPKTSELVGEEPAAIVEQEQVTPAEAAVARPSIISEASRITNELKQRWEQTAPGDRSETFNWISRAEVELENLIGNLAGNENAVARQNLIEEITGTKPTRQNSALKNVRQAIRGYLQANPLQEAATPTVKAAAQPEGVTQVAGVPPLVKELITAGRESAAQLRARISNVKIGPIENNVETFTFDIDGQPYRGELKGKNRDLVLGTNPTADAAIATRVLLDKNATPITPVTTPPVTEAVTPAPEAAPANPPKVNEIIAVDRKNNTEFALVKGLLPERPDMFSIGIRLIGSTQPFESGGYGHNTNKDRIMQRFFEKERTRLQDIEVKNQYFKNILSEEEAKVSEIETKKAAEKTAQEEQQRVFNEQKSSYEEAISKVKLPTGKSETMRFTAPDGSEQALDSTRYGNIGIRKVTSGKKPLYNVDHWHSGLRITQVASLSEAKKLAQAIIASGADISSKDIKESELEKMRPVVRYFVKGESVPQLPTPAVSETITPAPAPEAAPAQRDVTKPEQMTPEEAGIKAAQADIEIWKEKFPPERIAAEKAREGSSIAEKQIAYLEGKISSGEARSRGHIYQVENAAKEGKPVSASAVDTYNIILPEGYTKQGDLYVYQPAVSETITPAEPEGISVGNRIKLGKSPQTYIVEEVLPQSATEQELGEQYYSVRNERTGELQTVEKADLKLVKKMPIRKAFTEAIPTPDDKLVPAKDIINAVMKMFGKDFVSEYFTLIDDVNEKAKAAYEISSGTIYLNRAYLSTDDNIRDYIAHELGHYIAGDPTMTAKFQEFFDSLPAKDKATLDRFVEDVYNEETGEVRLEEKQVYAFIMRLNAGENRSAFQTIMDAIKKWLNKNLKTKFKMTDRDAAAILAGAVDRFKSGEFIPREEGFGTRYAKAVGEPRREQVAGKERGDIITTPEGIIKQTNEVLRNKFFDGSVVSDENTATAWDYIEQLLDIKSGAANALAGQINDVVDQETNSDSRMGASLFSVSLANYAAKLAAQGDNTMISYLIRRINRMPVDNLAGGISEAAEAMRAKREYNIDGYNTLKTEGKSKVERTAAALFGTDRPSEEQVKAVDDSIKASEDTSIGEPEEVVEEIEKVEKRTGRKVVNKIEDKIKESTEPKKEELLISFQNLNADKKIKGITLTYNPQKISPVKSIQNFIIGKLVDYRKTLIKQGASGLESTFWQTMSDQERKPGPLGEIDQAQNNELAKIVQKTLIDLGLKGEPPNTKMTDVEKVASILNKQKLSDEKRIEADQRIVSEIERRRESELASGSIPEAVNAKYDAILDAWNQAMSRQLNMPISDNMLQRLINSELKEQNTKISELVDEADGKVVAETKQNIVSSIIRKIYGVSKEFETGIEMDENYDGLKSYLEKTLDNMYALQIEKKNAAFAKRQANILLRNSVEGQAQSIIDQLADQLSDTPAFPKKQENQVKSIVQQDLRQRPDMKRKQPWTSQLTAKLIQVGVSEAQAETISNLVWRQHEIKAMDRELKELQTAAEKGSLAVIIQRIKDTPIADQQKPEWMQSVIRDYLVDAGLSEKAADTAAKLYESVIAERFAEAKQKAFEDTLSKSAPWKNYLSRNAQLGKNALKKIQDAIRTGVLDPTQTTEGIIAKENGWSGFSKEQLTRIVQLDGVISDPNNDQVSKAEAMSELNKIIVKAKMPVRFRDAISSYYVGQALMGIPTFTVNIASPTFFAVRNLAMDVVKYAATDPRNIPVAFQSFINSFQSLYDNSMYAFKNQIYMSGEIEYMQGQNVLSELFDKGKEQWAKGDYANGMFNMLVGATQITGRILSSLDQGAIEMMQSQNITRYTLEAMKGNRNIPKEKRSEIVNIAISGRRKIREELIASGMAPDRAGVLAELKVRSELTTSLSEVGVRATDVLNASLNDALQSVGRNRAITINSLKQEQNNLRDAGILSGLAIGFLENIAQGASKSSQSQQVFAKMLYGFALVPARVFSTAVWFSPIGFVRLGIDAALKSKGIESRYALSLATELQQKQRFIEAVAGSALLFGLGAALSSSTDDDEDKFFKIVVTGNGPDYNVDKQYHDSWHKNNKPQSVAIWFGKTKTTFNIGRGGEAISIPLLFLGGLDDARIKQKLNQARKSPADFEMVAEAIGSAFYGLAQRGPFAAFTKPLFDAKQSDKFVPKLFGQVGFLGKTFVPVLGTSIARNISDFINDPIDKSSVQGAIYSNIPIVGPAIGTKALNAFGQPIRADDWGDKLFKLGVPVVMSFPKNTPENELNQLVLKKGDGPPIPTRTNAQKKFEEPLTDKEFEIYVREYGRVVSEKMFKNRKKLENMDAKNYTKELDKYVNGYSIDEIKITGASDMAVRAVKRLRNE